jgi:hypothetical protein
VGVKVTRVYKFLSSDLALWDLRNRKIKISTFQDMNDPFEILGGHRSDPQLVAARTTLVALLNDWCGVLCFSRDWQDAMLWSHYADKHKGICIGLDVKVGKNLELKEPHYVVKRPDFDADMSALLAVASQVNDLKPSDFHACTAVMERMLLTKFSAWHYENEARCFVEMVPEQRRGSLYFAQLDEDIQPRMIILGPRCSTPAEEIQAAICGYSPPVAVVRTMLSPDSFQVIEDAIGSGRA